MMSEHIDGVIAHKALVASYMQQVASALFQRAAVHDNSKFSPEEMDAFEEVTPLLQTLTYGSEEYKEALKRLGPALAHHYAVNSHHPEHFPDGINGMNLMDVIEMVCDWMAAVKRVHDGDIQTSLPINQERFHIEDQMYAVICHTVDALSSLMCHVYTE
jgi:hypothetical protein